MRYKLFNDRAPSCRRLGGALAFLFISGALLPRSEKQKLDVKRGASIGEVEDGAVKKCLGCLDEGEIAREMSPPEVRTVPGSRARQARAIGSENGAKLGPTSIHRDHSIVPVLPTTIADHYRVSRSLYSTAVMSTIMRTLRNLRQIGINEYAHQMQYIGDTKAGTYIASDRYGNKYYENLADELPCISKSNLLLVMQS